MAARKNTSKRSKRYTREDLNAAAWDAFCEGARFGAIFDAQTDLDVAVGLTLINGVLTVPRIKEGALTIAEDVGVTVAA